MLPAVSERYYAPTYIFNKCEHADYSSPACIGIRIAKSLQQCFSRAADG